MGTLEFFRSEYFFMFRVQFFSKISINWVINGKNSYDFCWIINMSYRFSNLSHHCFWLHCWIEWSFFQSCSISIKKMAAFRGRHVSPAKHSYASVTDGQRDGRWIPMCRYASQVTQKLLKIVFPLIPIFMYVLFCKTIDDVTFRFSLRQHVWQPLKNIVAAFRGMHVSPAKHNYATKKVWLLDRHKYRRTEARQSDPYVPLCFTGDTKTIEHNLGKLATKLHHIWKPRKSKFKLREMTLEKEGHLWWKSNLICNPQYNSYHIWKER